LVPQPFGSSASQPKISAPIITTGQSAIIDSVSWVPELDSLGVGIDLPTGQLRLPIFDWTFTKNYTYTNPATRKVYSYPDQVLFSPETTATKSSRLYTSSEQSYILENSTDSFGFFLYGRDSQQIETVFSGGQSVLAVYYELHQLYKMTVIESAINGIPTSCFYAS
jgi:hypothetical protein